MNFIPIEKMLERVLNAREDSDTSLFLSLMYLGEMVTKIVVSGLVAGVLDDRDRNRYRQVHRLVRADGLGEWNQVLDDLLTGPSSLHLTAQAREEQRELNQKMGPGTWQHEAVALLSNCLQVVCPGSEQLPTKVDGRRWFAIFTSLRNATRGHGATAESSCSQVCPELEHSIRLVIENHRLLSRPWAYLRQNLSGKYHVVRLNKYSSGFEIVKGPPSLRLEDGVYVQFDQPVRVELIDSTVEAVDFFFPNGGFNGKRFELISYITGDKAEGDAARYLAPATALPVSETQGHGILDIRVMSLPTCPLFPPATSTEAY